MKKLAAFALLATAAAAASAQSSVTLFGVFDASLRSVKNGSATLKSVSSGGINSSRLGVRGVEDLGGGLKASFWLEHGFNADTGAQTDTSRFWGRRSTVSLLGSFGEVRIGRDFTPSYTGYADFDVFGDNGVAAAGKFTPTLGTDVDTRTRSDNEVSYFLPSGLGGFYGQVSIAAGEGNGGKKYAGGRLGYGAGPLNVSVAFGNTKVTPLVAGQDDHKLYDLGASYDFGFAKLSGYYTQTKYAAQKSVVYSLGASVPVTSLASVRVAYTKADLSGRNAAGNSIEANDANQFAIGGVYLLSKRTALYGTYARVDNKGSSAIAVSTPPVAVAGKKSTGYEVGVRHSF